jgi:hypothetical protein
MVGTFAGAPYTDYVLKPTDYVGSDLRSLDNWCLSLANRMHDYDYGVGVATNPYTTKTSDGVKILTTYGGSDFIAGIPSIADVRPDLFETSTQSVDYNSQAVTNAYDNAHAWQDQVGTIIAGDASVFGSVLGISGKSFASMAIWLAYIFAMLFIFASSKGSEAIFVMIICVPILYIGLHFRLIEYYILAGMAGLAILLFVIKMWFTK